MLCVIQLVSLVLSKTFLESSDRFYGSFTKGTCLSIYRTKSNLEHYTYKDLASAQSIRAPSATSASSAPSAPIRTEHR